MSAKETTQKYEIVEVGTPKRVLAKYLQVEAMQGRARRPLVLSYGAGLDSFFVLTRIFTDPDPVWQELRERLVAIVHADLGAELPETTWHLEHVAKPLAAEHGWGITVIRPRLYSGRTEQTYTNVRDYIAGQGFIPARREGNRWCSDKWKIQPIADWARRELGLGVYQVDMLIGFEANEKERRADRIPEKLRPFRALPLVELGWTRRAMGEALKAEGWPCPIKSRCSFCVFSNRSELYEVMDTHPEVYQADVEMEAAALAITSPRREAEGKAPFYLFDRSLEDIRARRPQKRAA